MSKWCSVSTSSNKSPRSQVTEVVPNVRGSSVRKLLHVSLLAHRILMCLLQFWNICKHCDMGQAICMYNIFAVSASYIYKGISKLRIYTHIYRGFCTAFVADICTGIYTHCFVGVQSHLLQGVTGMFRCQLETGCRCRLWLGSLWSSSKESGCLRSFLLWIRKYKTTSHI